MWLTHYRVSFVRRLLIVGSYLLQISLLFPGFDILHDIDYLFYFLDRLHGRVLRQLEILGLGVRFCLLNFLWLFHDSLDFLASLAHR